VEEIALSPTHYPQLTHPIRLLFRELRLPPRQFGHLVVSGFSNVWVHHAEKGCSVHIYRLNIIIEEKLTKCTFIKFDSTHNSDVAASVTPTAFRECDLEYSFVI